MPYHVRKIEGEWVVCKNRSGPAGKIFGRHGKNKSKARRQQSALYANTNEAIETAEDIRAIAESLDDG